MEEGSEGDRGIHPEVERVDWGGGRQEEVESLRSLESVLPRPTALQPGLNIVNNVTGLKTERRVVLKVRKQPWPRP